MTDDTKRAFIRMQQAASACSTAVHSAILMVCMLVPSCAPPQKAGRVILDASSGKIYIRGDVHIKPFAYDRDNLHLSLERLDTDSKLEDGSSSQVTARVLDNLDAMGATYQQKARMFEYLHDQGLLIAELVKKRPSKAPPPD